MTVYQILGENEPFLREKARLVPKITTNVLKLLENMADTMYDANGIGLAAPQVGVPKRVVVVDIGEGLYELINPVIVEASGEEIEQEGCLSIPDKMGDVARAAHVVLEAQNRNGETVRYDAEGLLARAFQHELDHLDGVLFIDRAESVYLKEPNFGGPLADS